MHTEQPSKKRNFLLECRHLGVLVVGSTVFRECIQFLIYDFTKEYSLAEQKVKIVSSILTN